MFPKPMAVRVNRKTWNLAVACLPGGFATIPTVDVFGGLLLINVFGDEVSRRRGPLSARYNRMREFDDDGAPVSMPLWSSSLTLSNQWMSEEDFVAKYKFVGKEKTDEFTEITML